MVTFPHTYHFSYSNGIISDQKLYQKLDDIRSHVNKSMVGKFVDKIDDKPTSDGKNKTNLTQI